MTQTKQIRIIIKDDNTAVYDFQLPAKTNAEDIASIISETYGTFLPERALLNSQNDQLTFAFAG